MNAEQVYDSLPYFLQNIACTAIGYRVISKRYGRTFLDLEDEIKDLPQTLANDTKLKYIDCVRKAAATCPYYTNDNRYSAWLEGSQTLDTLPILEKSTVRSMPSRFISNDCKIAFRSHTSGTTGAGLIFPVTSYFDSRKWATWWRYRKSHGLNQSTWCGYFGGSSIVPSARHSPPYWRMNYAAKQVMFSAYHLSPKTAKNYVSALNHHQPPWLHGYPSMISLLASLIQEQKLQLKYRPALITTGAESLLEHQRQAIEKVFECPLRQHYGMAEGVANISECEKGSLHVDEDFALVEFIPTQIDSTYKIIGTSFHNNAFPLVRYDTGDLAVVTGKSCTCGNKGRVVDSIEGRIEDYLTLPSGRKLGRLDHIFKDCVDIQEAQIYQPSLDRIVLRIVKSPMFGSQSKKQLVAETRKRVGDKIQLDVEYVDRITRTDTGKFKFVISDICSN